MAAVVWFSVQSPTSHYGGVANGSQLSQVEA